MLAFPIYYAASINVVINWSDDQFALYVSISIPFSTIHNAKYKLVNLLSCGNFANCYGDDWSWWDGEAGTVGSLMLFWWKLFAISFSSK